MGLTDTLAWIAGGRAEVFEAAPGHRMRYAAMGGVIVSTASVAAASATLAIHMAMGLAVPIAVLVGLIWGAIIFNLDRLLVVQMMRQQRPLMSLLAAVPRLLLAIVLGAVISTPVVLQIFRPEIDTELIVLHAENDEAYAKQIAANNDYAKIPGLQQQIATDQAALAKGTTIDIESDPEVVAARKQYDDAQKAYAAAEQAVVCEKEGKCGSGQRGAGIAFNEKVKIRDDRQRSRDDAQQRLDQARTAAQTNLTNASTTSAATIKARLAADQATLTDLTGRFEADKRRHAAQSAEDNGLLARLEALSRLSADRPTLETAHLTLFLLFLSLELLPVLMKLLQVLGPETNYDREAEEVDNEHAWSAAARRDVERDIEQDRLSRIKAAAMVTNQQVVATQSDVMRQVLDAWQKHTLAQSALDVHQWQAGLAAGNTPDDDLSDETTQQHSPIYRPAHYHSDWATPEPGESTIPINLPSHRPPIRGTAKVIESGIPPQRSVSGPPAAGDN